MRRQRRNTWILVGVVFLLGAAAMAEQMRDRLLAPKPLLAVAERDLRALVVECDGCTRRRLERVRGHWELTEPYALPASDERVAELLAILKAPVRHRYPAADFDAKKIGLSPPFAVLTVDRRRLEFGAIEPLHNDRYVKVGDQVAIAADRYSHVLRSTPEALVDPAPFAGLARLRAVRVDDVELPMTTVDRLKAARAVQVLPTAAGATGARVVADYGTNRTASFMLVSDGGITQLVRQDPVVVYVLDRATAALLAPPAAPPPQVPPPAAGGAR